MRGSLEREDSTFESNDQLRLHQQYGWQLHTLLARLTDSIETESEMSSRYAEYVDSGTKNRYEVEHDRVLRQVIAGSVADHSELYSKFEGEPSFKQWLGDRIFDMTYQPPGAEQAPEGC